MHPLYKPRAVAAGLAGRCMQWGPRHHRGFTMSQRQLSEKIRIVEVGPRDGLQNEKKSISVATKIELVRRLAATGLQTIEAGSFVHPKWVPQMADSSEILASLLKDPPAAAVPTTYQWLLPNARGLENYYSVQATACDRSGGDVSPAATHEISIFMAATESFSQKNTNCSITESIERFRPLIAEAKKRDTSVRAYISVALGCPFEGPQVSPSKVAELATTLLELGADEISVADTTGMGTPPRTLELLRTLSAAGIQNGDLAFHFHGGCMPIPVLSARGSQGPGLELRMVRLIDSADTYGLALSNTMVALEHGIRTFDSAVGGLGGCPFSPGATGNVATEDLIHCVHSLGADTGVELAEVAEIGEWISNELGRANDSRAGKATRARLRLRSAD